jgi:two-component system response regulator RegX3
MTRILLVEDEESYRMPLVYQLTKEGYEVSAWATGDEGLEAFATGHFDLVLLDLMIPGIDGVELARRIRQQSWVPIIMLTAKSAEIDKIVGLEIGADDYITKPYSFRELLARIRAVLRRREHEEALPAGRLDSAASSEVPLVVGRVELFSLEHKVSIDGAGVFFPLKEFELLRYLMQNQGRVLRRQQLIDRVWGADYVGDTKTLDVHIKRVRAKIEPDPSHPRYITTVRGLGYKMDSPTE